MFYLSLLPRLLTSISRVGLHLKAVHLNLHNPSWRHCQQECDSGSLLFLYMLVFLQLYWLVDTDKTADCKITGDWQPQGEWPLTLILQVDSSADHVLFPKYSNIHWADPVLLELTGHPRKKPYLTLFSNGTPEKFLLPHMFEL